MNILTPVDKPGEIPLLSKAGASEFYCGYLPINWINKYNNYLSKDKCYQRIQVSLNKREMIHANVTKIDELRTMVHEANQYNSKLFLTLNTFYYPGYIYKSLDKYIQEINEAGIDGVIVTDIGMIQYLHENYPKLKIILSCCTQVANKSAVQFFYDLGVKRITFPRHVTIDEMLSITNYFPKMEFECFILDARCIYDDGNCRILHSAGHFCYDQWEYNYYPSERNNKEISYEKINQLLLNEFYFTKWTKPYLTKEFRNNGWMASSCAACTVPTLLQKSSMTSLKIVGRGCNIGEKIIMVKFVKKILKLSINSDINEIKKYVGRILKIPEFCENRTGCLVPTMKL